MRWDKRHKKYVSRTNDEDGSKGTKLVKGESGLKIAASLRSGRFDAWRRTNKIDRLPRVGETERVSKGAVDPQARRYRHKAEKTPKAPDKYRDDYHKQKERLQNAKENRIGQFKDGTGRNEIKNIDVVRKERKLKERRKQRNGRLSRKRKGKQ